MAISRKPLLDPELRQLRETVELLSRKLETVERRLASTPGVTRRVKVKAIGYVGAWPEWRRRAIEERSMLRWLLPPGTHPQPLRPQPGNTCLTLKNSRYKLLGLTALGLPDNVLEDSVGHFARWQRQAMNFVPIFVTDSLRFDLFRRYGFVFEYVPGPKDRADFDGSRPWEEYIADRLELIRRKWGLPELVSLGPNTVKEQSGPGAPESAAERASPAQPGTTVLQVAAGEVVQPAADQ
jgi:hypothetical protein